MKSLNKLNKFTVENTAQNTGYRHLVECTVYFALERNIAEKFLRENTSLAFASFFFFSFFFSFFLRGSID